MPALICTYIHVYIQRHAYKHTYICILNMDLHTSIHAYTHPYIFTVRIGINTHIYIIYILYGK